MNERAFEDTHAALNDLLGFVLHAWPTVRQYGIYEKCLLRLAMNRDVLPNAPLSGNFYKEAEALKNHRNRARTMSTTTEALDTDEHTRWLGRLGERPDLSPLPPRVRNVLEMAERQGARWRCKGNRHNQWRLHASDGNGEILAYCSDAVTDIQVLSSIKAPEITP